MNGKGSIQRGTDREARDRYAKGWDAVFGSKISQALVKRALRIKRTGKAKRPKF